MELFWIRALEWIYTEDKRMVYITKRHINLSNSKKYITLVQNKKMETSYLLPHRFKKVGWLLFIPSAILGLLTLIYDWTPDFLNVNVFGIFIDEIIGTKRYFGFVYNNILNEILGVLVIISGLMIAFSKERVEDELITKIRLQSLVWATYWNYGILILAFLFVYDLSFLWVMIFNMYTVLIFFIIKFNWSLVKLNKALTYEE